MIGVKSYPLVLTLAFCLGLAGIDVSAQPAPCDVVKVGLDLSQARNAASAFLGHCPGQTFLAPETLVTSLTVWRWAAEWQSTIGWHLYITETDSTGFPLLRRIVVSAPTLVRIGDGSTPTPFRWDFSPPIALPRPGQYAFFVCQDPCLVYFDVLSTADGADLYDGGIFWQTERSARCNLESWPDPYPLADLIFQIEFCRQATTPVRPATWGRLKLIYR